MSEYKGWKTTADRKRSELSQDEIAQILTAIDREEARSQLQIPTERDAINLIHRARERLKRFGWQEAQYCPKDGSPFAVICAGSTGIFRCTYSGEWPDGYFMVEDGGDVYPTSLGVLMFRLLQPTKEPPR